MARTIRYTATDCNTLEIYPLIHSSDYIFSVGDVVKNNYGVCLTISEVDTSTDGNTKKNFEKTYDVAIQYITVTYGYGVSEIVSEHRDCNECNGIYTVSYSNDTKGWTSFWSYKPDWMIYLNNSFYTFNGQSLYKHNTNSTRNNFYGTQYSSQLSLLLNQQPGEVKMYNTIELDSTSTWDTDVRSDLSQGYIDGTYYVEKEGDFFAYIRRPDNSDYDLKSMSTQGIGGLLSVSTPVPDTLTFGFNISASISVGDIIYKESAGSLVLAGTILSYTKTTVTLTSSSATSLATGDFIVAAKNTQAESYGVRGYYMQVDLENSDTDYVELFSVTSSVNKSNGA